MTIIQAMRELADFAEERELAIHTIEVELNWDGKLQASLRPLDQAASANEQRYALAEWARALGVREIVEYGSTVHLDGNVGGIPLKVWALSQYFGAWTLDEGFKELIGS